MKKRYIPILILFSMVISWGAGLGAFAASEVETETERFMCQYYFSENSTLSVRDEVLVASFRGSAPTLLADSFGESDRSGCNAIRIVLKNNSTCNALRFSYMVGEETRELRIPITRRGDKEDYYLYATDIDKISDMKFAFSGGSSGSIEIYSVTAVSIYNDSAERAGTVTDCVYDPVKKTVRVNGTINHDITVNTRNATVELYAFELDVQVTEAAVAQATPVATMALSVRFDFEVTAPTFTERMRQYIVAIVSPDGEVLSLYAPQYPCIAAEESEFSESAFLKGVHTSYTNLANRADARLAVVDVYLDRMQTEKNNGFLHIVDGRYYYIDRAYVYSIDELVQQYSADGCTVYLRFLLSAGGNYINLYGTVEPSDDMRYHAILLENDAARRTLFAYTEFLCRRYSEDGTKKLGGVVVGRAVDDAAEFNYAGNSDLARYTTTYATTLYVISEAARGCNAALDVVVPLTSRCDDGVWRLDRQGRYSPRMLLTSLCKLLEDRFGSGLMIRVMLEDSTVPSKLLGTEIDERYASAENIDAFEDALIGHSERYGRITEGYFYYWEPDENVSEDALISGYAYIYYKLALGEAAGVVLSTASLSDSANIDALFEVVKYIDTQLGPRRNIQVPAAFGMESWTLLIPGFDADAVKERNIFIYEDYSVPSSNVVGSYIMWDHKQGRSIYDWSVGADCSKLSVEDANGGRALVAELTPTAEQAGYAEIIYAYSADEIMSVVDMLSVDVTVEGEPGCLYRLIFEICGDKASCEVSATVESGVPTTIYLSTQALDKSDFVSNIRLFCAPVETEEPYSLCIGQLAAHSNSLDDEALEEAIKEARLAAVSEEEGEGVEKRLPWQLGLSIILVTLFVSAAVIITLARRNEEF